MHVITIFTLIFLPGTFLAVRYLYQRYHDRHLYLLGILQRLFSADHLTWARQTFFSSGILNWTDDSSSSGTTTTPVSQDNDWVIRSSALKLFFWICVPMMLVILVGWFLLYLVARRKKQQKMEAVAKEMRDAMYRDTFSTEKSASRVGQPTLG